jgi:hypothetical protein
MRSVDADGPLVVEFSERPWSGRDKSMDALPPAATSVATLPARFQRAIMRSEKDSRPKKAIKNPAAHLRKSAGPEQRRGHRCYGSFSRMKNIRQLHQEDVLKQMSECSVEPCSLIHNRDHNSLFSNVQRLRNFFPIFWRVFRYSPISGAISRDVQGACLCRLSEN